jgi:acetyl-CoA/propionyl-CoA carboxylase, biotin carboxylase, biotin carboxyl carrier protein
MTDVTPIISPLVGTVCSQLCEDGATVAAGEHVVEIEAMKMMFPLAAPVGGKVRFTVSLGQVVGQDDVVAVIESE